MSCGGNCFDMNKKNSLFPAFPGNGDIEASWTLPPSSNAEFLTSVIVLNQILLSLITPFDLLASVLVASNCGFTRRIIVHHLSLNLRYFS